MCSEDIQLSVKPPAAANHENPDDTERTVSKKVESAAAVGVPDIKTNYQTEDTEILSKQTEISPREPDNTTKIEDDSEASDRNNTQHLKSDRTTDEEESSNTNLQSSTIATVDKMEKASGTDTQHSQSSSAPKSVRQHIQESVNSQVAVSEDKTDSLYPLRTHFMQVKGSTSKDADVTTISEES